MKTKFLMLAAAAFAFASCGNDTVGPKPPKPLAVGFTVELNGSTPLDQVIAVTPIAENTDAADTYYMAMCVLKSELGSELASNFLGRRLNEYREAKNISLTEAVKALCTTDGLANVGAKELTYRLLDPGTEYVSLVCGFDLNGKATTLPTETPFTTATPPTLEPSACTFDWTAVVPEGSYSAVRVDATPSDPTIHYYITLIEKETFLTQYGGSEADITKGESDGIRPSWYEVIRQMTLGNGYASITDFLGSAMGWARGKLENRSFSGNLYPDMTYVIVLAGTDDYGRATTPVFVKQVVMPPYVPSDATIHLTGAAFDGDAAMAKYPADFPEADYKNTLFFLVMPEFGPTAKEWSLMSSASDQIAAGRTEGWLYEQLEKNAYENWMYDANDPNSKKIGHYSVEKQSDLVLLGYQKDTETTHYVYGVAFNTEGKGGNIEGAKVIVGPDVVKPIDEMPYTPAPETRALHTVARMAQWGKLMAAPTQTTGQVFLGPRR